MKLKQIIRILIVVSLMAQLFANTAAADAITDDKLEFDLFPRGHLFTPLLADPKQPDFKLNTWWVDTSIRKTILGLVSLAESFGLFRWTNEARDQGFQIDISGGAFAQFDLLTESMDLVNTDFIGSLPLTWRSGDFSARFRIYHQSSHLGDEFLLNNSLTRVNLSFEAAELLVSYNWKDLRGYAGGEVVTRREPSNLDRLLIHYGLEYFHPKPLAHVTQGKGTILGVIAADVKMWQQDSFTPSVSIKAGFELIDTGDLFKEKRLIRVFAEFYHGISPFGQFFSDEVHVLGTGIGFQLSV